MATSYFPTAAEVYQESQTPTENANLLREAKIITLPRRVSVLEKRFMSEKTQDLRALYGVIVKVESQKEGHAIGYERLKNKLLELHQTPSQPFKRPELLDSYLEILEKHYGIIKRIEDERYGLRFSVSEKARHLHDRDKKTSF